MSLVSVLVPVYNVSKFLDECVQSIVEQTYKNIEIILVDDGATDGSGNICDRWKERDKRIKVVHQKNKGLVGARKTGLMMAQGNYISFVDGDDTVDRCFVEIMVAAIENNKVDFAHCGYIRNGVPNYVLPEKTINIKDNRLLCVKKYFRIDDQGDMWISSNLANKVFTTDVIKDAYFHTPDDCSYGEDFVTVFYCLLHCSSLHIVEQALYNYRRREHSLSDQASLRQLLYDHSKLHLVLGDMVKDSAFERFFDFSEWSDSRLISLISAFDRKGRIRKYDYPSIQKLYGLRTIIYGAGAVGADYYCMISHYSKCQIIMWVDKNYEKYCYDFCEIRSPESILQMEFDVVLIAILNENTAKKIVSELKNMGVSADKILWERPIVL